VRHPLVPLYLFKSWNYLALVAVSSVGSMIFYAVSIVWPQQIALPYNTSSDTTGWISVGADVRPLKI
jgi:hypothetical protein